MKPNINDVSNLNNLRGALAEQNVSATAIATLEKALKRGMSFEGPEDLAILDLAAADVGALGEAVVFGAATAAASNVKTVEYQFDPIGDPNAFVGYQLIVRFVSDAGFTTEEAYPIEDDRRVLVDYDLAAILPGSRVALHVNTATGSHTKLKLQNSAADAQDVVSVASTDLVNGVLEVNVDARTSGPNPIVAAAYPVKGKMVSNQGDAKLDGYQVVLFAATNPSSTAPDFTAVAVAHTETNGNFVTAPLLFEHAEDIDHVTAAKATISKADFSTEVPVRLVTIPETGTTPSTSRIPDRLILMIVESADGAIAAVTGECGCNDLKFLDKKVLEEHSYYSVVRTSEPSIIADVLEDERQIDLQDIYGVPLVVPFAVFQKYHEIESRQLKPVLPAAVDASPTSGAS